MTAMNDAILSTLARDAGWGRLSKPCLETLLAHGTPEVVAQDKRFAGSSAIVLQGVLGGFQGQSLSGAPVTALYLPLDLIDVTDLAPGRGGQIAALRPARVLSFEPKALKQAAQRFPELSHEVLRRLKQQAQNLQDRIADLTGKTPEQRLAAFLLWLAEGNAADRGSNLFELPMRRYDMARYLGMQPETLSRKIKGLAAGGIIRLQGPNLCGIQNPSELRMLAGAIRTAA